MKDTTATEVLQRLIQTTPVINYIQSSKTPGKMVRNGVGSNDTDRHIFACAVTQGTRLYKVLIGYDISDPNGPWHAVFGECSDGPRYKFKSKSANVKHYFNDEVAAILFFVNEAWPTAVTLSKL